MGLEGRSATVRGGVEKIFEDTKIIRDQVPQRPHHILHTVTVFHCTPKEYTSRGVVDQRGATT